MLPSHGLQPLSSRLRSLPNCEGELASVVLRRVAYGRAPGLLSARMHDWSPCEVGRTRETGSLPHTELGASISSRRGAPLLEAQVTLHGLSVESVLATERAASTAATRRSEVMSTLASRRRKALHCCTDRRRRAAHLCLNVSEKVELGPKVALRWRCRAFLCMAFDSRLRVQVYAGPRCGEAASCVCRRRGVARDGKTIVFAPMRPARRNQVRREC